MYVTSLVRALLPMLNKTKVLWLGFNVQRQQGFTARLKRQVIGFALKRADLVICNSKGQIRLLRMLYPSTADKLVYVRYSGPSRLPAGAYKLAKATDLGYIFSGGHGNRDYLTLIAAVGEIGCPAKLVMTPSYRRNLNAFLPDQIEIYENIPFEQFSHLLAQSAFVVLTLRDPSISSGQLVLLQAMELGKAVIITAVEGMDDYIENGHDALLVKPGDVEDLKSKMKILLTDPEFRGQIAQNAHLSFQARFKWENYVRDVARLVRTITSVQ